MKYNYKGKLSKVILGIMIIFLSNNLLAKETHLKGCITKVFNDGAKQPFSYQKIKIKNANINTMTYTKGCFDFNLTTRKDLIGKEIKLEVPNSNWYMYEPSQGLIVSPKEKKTKNIKIFMMRKDSSAYLTLFSEISHYTIQTAHFSVESSAIDMVKKLRENCRHKTHRELPDWLKKPCWKFKGKNVKREKIKKLKLKEKECVNKEQKRYCIDSIYYESVWKNNIPNNGYMYNVHYGHYYDRENAEKDLKNIRGLKGGWIKTHTIVKE